MPRRNRTRTAPSTASRLLLASLFPLLAACGDGGGSPTDTKNPARVPSSITLSPPSVTLDAIEATAQLSAVVRDQSGQTIAGTAVSWTVDNAAVATVGTTGSVKAVAVGTATIVASVGPVTASTSITVRQLVSSVQVVTPTEVVHNLGETVQFIAAVQDANGHPIPGAPVNWSSSDPDCVSIDPNTGLATAIGFGAATITATAEAASASAPLAVTYVTSSGHELLGFSFPSSKNPDLSQDAEGVIDGDNVTILVPQAADATHFVAAFSLSPGASLEIDGVEQVDGESENDFTRVIHAAVTAEDQSQGTYTIYVGRSLKPGEVVGWQRDAGSFRYYSDPGDIEALEQIRVHLDSIFPFMVDTLHATFTDTVRLDVFPSKAAFHDELRRLGFNPHDWWTGVAIGTDRIMTVSPDSPDIPAEDRNLQNLLSAVAHEATHSIVATFGSAKDQSWHTGVPGTQSLRWLNEGLASLADRTTGLLAECFPRCPGEWEWQRSVVASTGKPDLETMFLSDPAVGYGFSITLPPFIVDRYGWGALRGFLEAPWDYSVFGLADSHAFEHKWYDFLDEVWGWVKPGHPPVLPIAEARTAQVRRISVEGTVTWQASWDSRIFFLQDETGGLNVFQAHDAIPLAEGDRVRVIATVGRYRGEFQLSDVFETTVLAQEAVPDPRVVTGAQINAGQFQGELVEVQGSVQAVSLLAYGNQRVTLRDSAGTDFPVFVDSRTGMTLPDWPAVGTAVRVRGVLGTDDRTDVPEGTGPRLEPRRKGDLTVIQP